MATIAEHGDPRERKHWPVVQTFFPLYEAFWDRHIVSLRGPTGRVRADVDAALELLAQSHFKCFQSLRLAQKKLDETRHAEQTFSHLQNAANRAREVIMQFDQLRAACAPAVDVVPDAELAAFAMRITKYRNAIHEDMLPMCVIDGQMHIPKVDRLDKYSDGPRWRPLTALISWCSVENSTMTSTNSAD